MVMKGATEAILFSSYADTLTTNNRSLTCKCLSYKKLEDEVVVLYFTLFAFHNKANY